MRIIAHLWMLTAAAAFKRDYYHAPRAKPGPGQALDGKGNICWKNLTALEEFEIKLVYENVLATNSIPFRRYILCPNTDFPIASFDFDIFAYDFDGGRLQLPLNMMQNQLIQCGHDGKSSNNCRLVGGAFQLLAGLSENVTVKGITFDGASDYAASASPSFGTSPRSTITFTDCIFENAASKFVIDAYASFDDFFAGVTFDDDSFTDDQFGAGNTTNATDAGSEQRKLEVVPMTEERAELMETLARRRLHGGGVGDIELTLTLEGCAFRNNTRVIPEFESGRPSMIVTYGNISSLIVNNCVFEDNDYTSRNESAIINAAGDVKLSKSCFTGNRFGAALAIVNGTASIANNFVDDASAQAPCQLSEFDQGDFTFDPKEGTCVDFPKPSPTCPANIQKKCKKHRECKDHEYCSKKGYCMEYGKCLVHRDCKKKRNKYSAKKKRDQCESSSDHYWRHLTAEKDGVDGEEMMVDDGHRDLMRKKDKLVCENEECVWDCA